MNKTTLMASCLICAFLGPQQAFDSTEFGCIDLLRLAAEVSSMWCRVVHTLSAAVNVI